MAGPFFEVCLPYFLHADLITKKVDCYAAPVTHSTDATLSAYAFRFIHYHLLASSPSPSRIVVLQVGNHNGLSQLCGGAMNLKFLTSAFQR